MLKGFHEGSLDLTGRHPWRYRLYFTRWTSYISAFNHVARYTILEEETIGTGDVTFQLPHYVVTKPGVLEEFEREWKPPYWNVLYPATLEVVKFMMDSPEPRFQNILLTHLPTEILDRVFFFASSTQAILLGSTCRLLREVSLRWIYEGRSLVFRYKPDYSKPLEEEDQDDLAENAKAQLMNTIDSLLARPDIVQKTLNIHIYDEWQSHRDILRGDVSIFTVNDELFQGLELNQDFYGPLLAKIGEFIRACTNATHLSLASILVTPVIAGAIISLPHLHTLSLRGCNFAAGLPLFMDERASTPPILNMRLSHPRFLWENWWYWAFLSLSPDVRTLSVSGSRRDPIQVLQDPMREMYNPWPTVERFSVTALAPYQIPTLTSWIELSKADWPLRLTHFMVDTHYPMDQEDLFMLVDALRGAPLQILALSGVRYAGLDLIDRIAEAFPDLVGLTLIHRYKVIKDFERARLSMWPHASWEYAPRFGAFSRLEHLGMNFYCPPTTGFLDDGVIESMETGVPCDCYVLPCLEEEEDNDTVARVFAVHCPSLKSFTLHAMPLLNATFIISRRPDGYPIVEGENNWNGIYGPIPLPYFPLKLGEFSWDPISPEAAGASS